MSWHLLKFLFLTTGLYRTIGKTKTYHGDAETRRAAKIGEWQPNTDDTEGIA
jgi:hypothetical protein